MNKERVIKGAGKLVAGTVIAAELLVGGGKALANEKKFDSSIKPQQGIECLIGEAMSIEPKTGIDTAISIEPGYKASPFVDIYGENFSDSYRIAIERLWEKGIISGYDNDGQLEFRPENPLTRGQAVKMVVKTIDLLGIGLDKVSAKTFPDVSSKDPFFNYINKATEYGIVKGDEKGNFNTYNNVTRAQLITMCMRAADSIINGIYSTTEPDFIGQLNTDVYTNGFHGANILKAEGNRILKDLEGFDSNWDSDRVATRAETARILTNLYYSIHLITNPQS